ncbi:hypothetical protein B0H12DRAFT_1229110 [Mycena haematopus]|nr:hypothetical protein B0H12DRAFT_1229110 [Mycena haematopus]
MVHLIAAIVSSLGEVNPVSFSVRFGSDWMNGDADVALLMATDHATGACGSLSGSTASGRRRGALHQIYICRHNKTRIGVNDGDVASPSHVRCLTAQQHANLVPYTLHRHSDVRHAALLHVPLTAPTLPTILAHTRGVDPLNLVSVLTSCLQHPRHLAIANAITSFRGASATASLPYASPNLCSLWTRVRTHCPGGWTRDDGGARAWARTWQRHFAVLVAPPQDDARHDGARPARPHCAPHTGGVPRGLRVLGHAYGLAVLVSEACEGTRRAHRRMDFEVAWLALAGPNFVHPHHRRSPRRGVGLRCSFCCLCPSLRLSRGQDGLGLSDLATQ